MKERRGIKCACARHWEFLNNLEGEVVAIVPNVTPKMTPGGMGAEVNFLLIVEKVK